MARVLQARALAIEVAGTILAEDIGFTVRAGDKVGLVGRNGAGKTSLLKVMAGMTPPAAGIVHHTGALGYLPQDPKLDGVDDSLSALTHVLSGRGLDRDIVALEKLRLKLEENPSEENVAKYSRAHDRFEHAGGYAAESEVRSLCAGLGLTGDRVDRSLGVLSGGERRRVELARILFAGSDVLLLDEPTNHLDNDARDWLLTFLRRYRGALLVISHDLELLDEAITRVLHLDRNHEDATGDLYEYKGTYSQYFKARRADEERRRRLAARQATEIARLQRLVDRFGAKQSKASMAHSLEKRIERIKAGGVDAPEHQRVMRLGLPVPPSSGRTVLEIEGLSKSYGALDVFDD